MFLSATPHLIVLTLLSIPNLSNAQCTITSYDANAIKQAQSDCSEITLDNFEVPAGETLDLSRLKEGTKVIFKGTITWGFEEWGGPLIKTAGNNVEITGAEGHVLDGRGLLWWDGLGGTGTTKPKFFRIGVTNSDVHGLNVKNTPINGFSVNGCDGTLVRDIIMDNRAGDIANGGHNTDAFDVNANNVVIRNVTVYNQDDCIAINSGYNITFEDSYCSGGHGISIGSVGGRDKNDVQVIRMRNTQVVNSDNGVRIKTVFGATGSVKDVIYEDITLTNIKKYGIVIHSDYPDNNGVPSGGVPVTDLTVRNVQGTVASGGVNVYILVENAANWQFSNVQVTGGTKTKECTGIPSGAGISC